MGQRCLLSLRYLTGFAKGKKKKISCLSHIFYGDKLLASNLFFPRTCCPLEATWIYTYVKIMHKQGSVRSELMGSVVKIWWKRGETVDPVHCLKGFRINMRSNQHYKPLISLTSSADINMRNHKWYHGPLTVLPWRNLKVCQQSFFFCFKLGRRECGRKRMKNGWCGLTTFTKISKGYQFWSET